MSLALPDRIPDYVLEALPGSRVREPDESGFVEDEAGVRVYWEAFGDSDDVVCLLPPWALGHSRGWRAQVPYLSRHFRVITIDPRGNGRSDRPEHAAAYSRAAHVGDTLAVLDATGTDSAMMVSVSPRGALGLDLAANHADRVRASVFVTPQLWAERDFLDWFKGGRREGYDGTSKMNPHYWREDFRGFVEWFARWASPHRHSMRQIEEIVHHGLGTDAETLIRATVGFEMYEREEALATARRVRCPVLVTQNGGKAMYPKHTSGPLAEATGGRLHVFEGLGPAIASRWPVAMNIVVREFLESVRAGDAVGREAVA
ncbi:MAG TPA: alpha/beta hydrolase [Thermoleophilaceae bacterium]|nr:alpha/beta hydrolase [Thermoleophilaceae bacterium]